MIEAALSMSALGLGLGLLLGVAARKFHVETPPVVDAIDGILPGTNCGACGYPGCRGLAEAMAEGSAPVTACTPGGRDVALALAAIVEPGGGGAAVPGMAEAEPMVAFIFEDHCTGCMRCFKRCPTDAIIGANKQIHTVVTDACIGCNACIEACPTEAIVARVKPKTLKSWYWDKPLPDAGADSREHAA
ncbi:RnfABCDGE type electron transport complex subunit B [Cereibacter azotoformans]|uniref:Ion-translocating oxidoreductase complex subunit B n=1 Tax=Cereibacter azotoformans TaxID=43057 RepID=A0A2T5KAD0_9RHOB|nr:RnfABCDGE type electron transport complex subunit B [Cereibacter azotoformans]AXQ95228.1 RnfABCDGE type electron transport complex subunit B [Cereibacter sphaeroides]PTR19349.1 electron transport complex protein RnfB [Cereibacter azotoformans]UIJ32555.1 RnfABCDGE type electron transport complex subunit B [Cereibacter azotoformans]